MPRKTVILGLLGTTLDTGRGDKRWERWRPTLSLCQQEDLDVARMDLLYPRMATNLTETIRDDIIQVSPSTEVCCHLVDPKDPWDFEEVYTALHDFADQYPFDPEREDYLVHITTGTHVAQICLFLLTETRKFPARLIQTSPRNKHTGSEGQYKIIDLDLSKYHHIAARFQREFKDNITGLKSGIATRNKTFNRLIEEVEHVAANSADPMLLMGPTGAGKSQLARRVFELRRHRNLVTGSFVEVNCATIRGDSAMSTLFGHRKGAFTGAASDRPGLLRSADKGVLFLDEIGELGLDEQAMLLRALEEKCFLPLGADTESSSDFQLIAGTNRDLYTRVRSGDFREDLLARINLWTFCLPALRERPEDIEPNLEYELNQFAKRTGRTVRFSTESRELYLRFATSKAALWNGNFRDLSASITRMATLSPSGRITDDLVHAEMTRLTHAWGGASANPAEDLCTQTLGPAATDLDRFDRVQLNDVLAVCKQSESLSEAGRALFGYSRALKTSVNDSDRLRKYLARFNLRWDKGQVTRAAD